MPKGPKGEKRPADVIGGAVKVMKIATGEIEEENLDEGKNIHAVALGRLGGAKGGKPERKHISTSYVERQNLTMRMQMRRFTRLTNAFSKKFENHVAMVALYTVWYNFVKQHKSLKGLSPAMEAGISKTLWSMEDITALIDAAAPKPGPRGSYKKKNSN